MAQKPSPLLGVLTREIAKTGLPQTIGNPIRMGIDRIVRNAFHSDGRLRDEMVPSQLGGLWNGKHAEIGGAHLWWDRANQCLRAKKGSPTSETDGTVVVDL